ncbi:NACHT domain-containing protein [Microcoleus sp. OTE_8_concoct_300]|uniref:NACHT domain-containing protein n=1 Tax=Microcoleus sp. OTE_8_concoct_300 TaxID=2964710 RepID=UPI00403F21E0
MSKTANSSTIGLTPEGLEKVLERMAQLPRPEKPDKKGWTHGDLAEKSGVSIDTVKRFLKKERIRRDCITWLAQALNLEIPEIVDRHEWSPPSLPATQIDWRETCRAAAQTKRQAANTFFVNDLGRKIDLNEIHVPLGLIERQQKPQRRDDFSPQTGSQAYQEAEKLTPLSYDEFCEKVLANSDSPKSKGKRLAVIGEPGAGKTTQLFKIGDRILAETEYLPVWISLAEVKKPLCQYLIEDWLRIAAGQLDAAPAEWVKEFKELLSEGKIWLLLDGADEMGIADSLGTLSPQLRERVFDKVRIVISCRLNIWEATGNSLSDFDTYRMLDFSYGDGENCDQVKLFIDRWFRSPPAPLKKGGAGEVYSIENEQNSVTSLTPPLTKGGLGGDLRAALDEPGKERIKDLVRNPLRLFLLCLTWEFGQQKLPDTKAELYEVFVAALYDFKKQAFPTTAAQRTNLNAALGKLALTAIEAGYKSILPDWFVSNHLEQPHPELFEKAIDLGWLNRVGVDAENPLKSVYAFYHPTFQEYFAACEIEDWHFFLNHVPQNPQQGIYRIFERQWKEVMLLWMGRKDVDREEKEAFIKALVEFEQGTEREFYGYRAYFLAAVLIDEFKDCSLADAIVAQIVQWGFGYFNIEKQEWRRFIDTIAKGAKAVLPESDRTRVIVALTKLIRTSENESIQRQAANSLGKIGQGNPDAIAALTELIRTSENENIRWQAAGNLGKIDEGNPDSIAALTELIRTSENEDIRWQAADSLGKIDEGHPDSIAALTELTGTSENKFIRLLAAGSLWKIDTNRLGEIDEGNPYPYPIADLTQFILTCEDKYRQETAAFFLTKMTETQQMTGVVTALKNCLSDETYKNDFERFKNSYEVIWHCAQNLPYPTFYHAWHHPPTTPHPEVPDWQTFPQDIAREINNQAELSNQIQLLCIDSKNFINPDNPAAKIYTEMLKQGCPKSEDGTPKTMADLQTYWDLLLMDSEKSFILVFYNSRGEEATGFSETFVNDLSKFDGNIAIVSENNAHSLAAFSPSQSDLIGAIVRWICQVVWES